MNIERSLLSIARRHMATDFELEVVVGPHTLRIAESVLAEAHHLIESIESALSEFRETSPVYRLNRSKPGEWVPFVPAVRDLMEISRELSAESNGAFSPFSRSPYAANLADLEIEESPARFRRL